MSGSDSDRRCKVLGFFLGFTRFSCAPGSNSRPAMVLVFTNVSYSEGTFSSVLVIIFYLHNFYFCQEAKLSIDQSVSFG